MFFDENHTEAIKEQKQTHNRAAKRWKTEKQRQLATSTFYRSARLGWACFAFCVSHVSWLNRPGREIARTLLQTKRKQQSALQKYEQKNREAMKRRHETEGKPAMSQAAQNEKTAQINQCKVQRQWEHENLLSLVICQQEGCRMRRTDVMSPASAEQSKKRKRAERKRRNKATVRISQTKRKAIIYQERRQKEKKKRRMKEHKKQQNKGRTPNKKAKRSKQWKRDANLMYVALDRLESRVPHSQQPWEWASLMVSAEIVKKQS